MAGLFPPTEYPQVLVGLARPDDAAAYDLGDGRALIATTDFLTPVVDDPFLFGAIAAANAMSDVYAMGGEVVMALNLAVFPECLADDVVGQMLRGGAAKVREAGGALVGGHTIVGPEPVFGLAVVGIAPKNRLWTKGGARPGDRLLLSKPLGLGLVATALKADLAAPEDVHEATSWMARLNRQTAHLAREATVHGATDITGFSLLGHGWEMAHHSGVGLRLHLDSLPFVSGAKRYAYDWLFPAGANTNEAAYVEHVVFPSSLEDELRLLLFTPETSGGLLLSVPEAAVGGLLEAAKRLSTPLWLIGETTEAAGVVEVVD